MSQLWSDRPLGVKLSALVAAGTLSLGVFAVVAVTEILDTGGFKGVLLASTMAEQGAGGLHQVGDAAKGFAVVANEVKEPAREAARATQADAEGAVQAINEISAIIELINDSQSGIAAAVEEQRATTTEMNRNVGEAAVWAGQIAESITSVVRP